MSKILTLFAVISTVNTIENLVEPILNHLDRFFTKEDILLVPPTRDPKTKRLITPPAPDVVDIAFKHYVQRRVVLVMSKLETPPITSYDEIVRITPSKQVIVLTSTGNEFKEIKKLSESLYWDSNGRVLLFLRNGNARELLEFLWKRRKACNVTVFVYFGGKGHFYTLLPYNGSFVEVGEDDVFPEKVPKDFGGFVLKVGTTVSEPYVMEPRIEGVYEDGIEMKALDVLKKFLNVRFEFVLPPNGENPWVFLGPNGTVTGLFGLLDRREVDIIFHGIPESFARCIIGDSLSPHLHNGVHWVTPLHEDEDDFGVLTGSFTNSLWALIIFTMVGMAVILYVTVPRRGMRRMLLIDPGKCFLYSISVNLYMSIPIKPQTLPMRFIVATFFAYTLITTMSYQSKMYIMFTKPRAVNQLETFEEIVDAGLIGYLYPSGKPTYNQTQHELWNKVLTPGRHVFTDDYVTILHIIRYNRTIFSQMPKNVALYEISKNHLDSSKRPLVNFVPDTVLPFNPTFYVPKGHPLKEVLRKVLHGLVDGGMFEHWVKEVLVLDRTRGSVTPKPLRLHQIRAIFYVWMVLLGLALFLFLSERFLYLIERNFKLE